MPEYIKRQTITIYIIPQTHIKVNTYSLFYYIIYYYIRKNADNLIKGRRLEYHL